MIFPQPAGRKFVGLEYLGSVYRLSRKSVAILFMIVLAFTADRTQSLPIQESDLVHYGDVIDVDVVGGFEFDWRGTVDPEGILAGLNIYGNPVLGICRSTKEIERDVIKEYSLVLRDPKVVVRIVDRADRAETILDGAVKYPKRFRLKRPARLQELIVKTGGITDDAGGEIQLFRPESLNCDQRIVKESSDSPFNRAIFKSNDTQLTIIKISDLLSGEEISNPFVRSGDLITVRRGTPVYLIGGVQNPSNIPYKPGLTLSRAVAMAGGLSKSGMSSQVTVYRRENGAPISLFADLQMIGAGKMSDVELKALDIVEVRQKGDSERKFPPMISSVPAERLAKLPLAIIE